MKGSTDYSLQDLVRASESLLEDVDQAGDLATVPSEETERKVKEEALKTFILAAEEEAEYPVDGYAEVTVSEDGMTARAGFFPPSGGGQPLSPDGLARTLEADGIRFGVNWEAIKEALFRCNTEQLEIPNIVIARGRDPVNQSPAHLLIEERLMQSPQMPDADGERMDFREITPFVIVREGEVLAKLVPERSGSEGYTVHGRALPYQTTKPLRLQAGKNTRLEGDQVLADRDGRFQRGEGSFWVNEVLELQGDVDYRTGHVDFPGDVLIRGEIKAGFRVHSGGSVYCAKTMDASEVRTAGDLVVRWGLIGRKSGSVKVGGEVTARFIENCYVEAKGPVRVEVGILNSAVFSGDRVELGRKGVIAGGSVTAQNGVRATQLGTRMGPRTEIYCGTDYAVEQKLEWIRNKNMELAFKLKDIERRLKRPNGDGGRLLEIQRRIRETIHKLNETAQSLVFRLDKNESAEVVVGGYVYPGVYIEVCHVSFVVVRALKGVRFSLDKEKGKIIVDPLLG
ncbi:MAG: DUF342 domain-containing protein [Spirochaetales bacterium]|nr:DUF342 domain-containing protein [Spirochaetales bacterium]